MIIEKIGTGSSIAQAYENAKALLAAPEDAELHQEIIQDAKKKLFGLKIEPAKVKVWYEVQEKPVHADKTAVYNQAKEKILNQAAAKKERPKAPAKDEKQTKKAPEKQQPTPEKKEAAKSVVMTEEKIDDNDNTAKYLKMMIDGIGIKDYTIKLEKDAASNEYVYIVECDEDGTLIGRRGETLDSIQYLLRLFVNKGNDEDKHRKVSVNIGNYREKRNDNLRALAQRSAKQVLKYGRNVVLDPMNPYERRIIHTAIQEIDGVTSHSIGVDAGRKVIISLEDGVQPTNPSKGGYNNRGQRRDNRRGQKGSYQKREPYAPEVTRAPRKDTAGSLYGKIEIPSKNSEE